MTDPRLQDKSWRVNHLYWIKNKLKKMVKFKQNRMQRELEATAWHRNIILKSRQLGVTTYESVDNLDDVLFNPNFDSLFIAQDLETAKDIFSNKIDLAWKNYNANLKAYDLDTSSARRLKFIFTPAARALLGLPASERQEESSITVDSSGRAQTFSRVHVTEFAQVCAMYPMKATEIIEGTFPAVPKNGRIDIESTAEGEGGEFHDMFWDAWNRGAPTSSEQFKAHFFNWQYDDEEIAMTEPIVELPQEFREYQKIHNLNPKEIAYYFNKWQSLNKNWNALRRNYPTTPEEAFTYSGNKLFNAERIMAMKRLCEAGEVKGNWIIYERPQRGHHYAMGGDVAEGVGQDSSTLVIVDYTKAKPKVVAIFRDNMIDPILFAYEAKQYAEIYNMAFIAIERNNHGHATISKLREIYPERNIYQEGNKFGWNTTLVTKPKMMYDFALAIQDDLIDIPSKEVLAEAQLYDKAELSMIRFNAESTKHFDLLIATTIAFQMRNERPRDIVGRTPVTVHKGSMPKTYGGAR